jgi:hypothetical protein
MRSLEAWWIGWVGGTTAARAFSELGLVFHLLHLFHRPRVKFHFLPPPTLRADSISLVWSPTMQEILSMRVLEHLEDVDEAGLSPPVGAPPSGRPADNLTGTET